MTDDTAYASAAPDPGSALFNLLTPVRRRLGAAIGLAAAGAVLGVAGFALVALALREPLRPDRSGGTVAVLLGLALLGLLARFALRAAAFHVSHVASSDLEVLLRTRLAEHLGRVPLGVVQALGSGAVKKVVHDD